MSLVKPVPDIFPFSPSGELSPCLGQRHIAVSWLSKGLLLSSSRGARSMCRRWGVPRGTPPGSRRRSNASWIREPSLSRNPTWVFSRQYLSILHESKPVRTAILDPTALREVTVRPPKVRILVRHRRCNQRHSSDDIQKASAKPVPKKDDTVLFRWHIGGADGLSARIKDGDSLAWILDGFGTTFRAFRLSETTADFSRAVGSIGSPSISTLQVCSTSKSDVNGALHPLGQW